MSTIPAVLDELVARFAAALPDADVFDGAPLATDTKDYIVVGFDTEDGFAVEANLARQQLSAEPDREIYDVFCLASAWDGGTDIKRVRDKAYALVAAANQALRQDVMLGGLAMQVSLTTHSLAQGLLAEGATVTVRFVVHVDAYTS